MQNILLVDDGEDFVYDDSSLLKHLGCPVVSRHCENGHIVELPQLTD